MKSITTPFARLSLVGVFALGIASGCEEQDGAPLSGDTPPATDPADDPAAPLPNDAATPGTENPQNNNEQDTYQPPAPPRTE